MLSYESQWPRFYFKVTSLLKINFLVRSCLWLDIVYWLLHDYIRYIHFMVITSCILGEIIDEFRDYADLLHWPWVCLSKVLETVHNTQLCLASPAYAGFRCSRRMIKVTAASSRFKVLHFGLSASVRQIVFKLYKDKAMCLNHLVHARKIQRLFVTCFEWSYTFLSPMC